MSRTRGGTQEGEVLGRTVLRLEEQGRLLRKDTLYVSRTREFTQEGQSLC